MHFVKMQAQQEENYNFELSSAEKVFKEELLREKILRYAIHDDFGSKVNPAYIKCYRLVQKPWLETISKVLQYRRISIFSIHLTKKNSLETSTFVQKNGKLLQQFLNHVLGQSRIDDRVPPFSLKVELDFFREENYPNFLRCLRFCRGSLIELNLTFPLNGGSMPLLLPVMNFLILQKITVTFSASKITYSGAIKPANAGNNAIVTHFMQSLFNGCVELEEFCVPYVSGNNLLPFGFEYLMLPTTITTLKLFCEMKNKHFELLLRSNLPKLKILHIVIPFTTIKKDLIFNILEKFRKTLVSLAIEGISHDGIPKNTSKFRLPLMTNLEKLDVSSTHCELESDLQLIEQNLPKLKSFVLEDQTVHMFQKWVQDSTFVKVNFLRASIADMNYSFDHEKFHVNFNEDLMESLCIAFPNVSTLQVTLCGTDMSGLQLIFQEMKHIQTLSIIVKRSDHIVNSDFWDALLIGVPVEWAAALRTTPAFWKSLKLRDNGLPSIRKLNKLRELYLKNKESTSVNGSLISDAVFHFAFIKMSALEYLSFNGRFMVSPEMARRWNKLGRVLC